MSHFTVLIIGEDPESQLIPFQENNNGDCPQEYMEFEDTEDEWMEEYQKGKTKAVKMKDGTYAFEWDERFRVKDRVIFSESPEHVIPNGLKLADVPFKKLYKTFEDYAREYHGYSERDDVEGRYGYWHNPNAKWDWYQIGGRWAGLFKLKPGCIGNQGERSWSNENKKMPYNKVSQAKKEDIDWDGMKEEQLNELEKYWSESQSQETGIKEFKYGIKGKMTKEEYFAENSEFSTFAILKDGEWHESGEMGWWACVSNKKDSCNWHKEFMDILNSLEPETLLTVVDCHI